MNRFSLIVTSFNLEKYIQQCLESLLDQDYPQTMYQIVCVDDGSTDGSLSLIKSLAAKHPVLTVIS